MECEICGKKEAVCLVYLEGAQMNACAGCARGGKVVYYFETESGSAAPVHVSQLSRSEEEIVDGYGKLIRSARERMGLTPEQLALRISEKVSYLEHVEKGSLLPTLPLAKKLEKFLKIRLVEMSNTVQTETKLGSGKKELTMLDVAEITRKEDKKKK